MKLTKNRSQTLLLCGILVILSIIPLFVNLGAYILALWDESRYAASAYEMLQIGNPFIVTFDFKPDMWGTKPPFVLWCQALSIKILD